MFVLVVDRVKLTLIELGRPSSTQTQLTNTIFVTLHSIRTLAAILWSSIRERYFIS